MEREQIDRIQAWMEEHRAAMEADIMRLGAYPKRFRARTGGKAPSVRPAATPCMRC